MVALGGSMWPTFRDGNLLHFEAYDGIHTRRGDVIVFAPPGTNTVVIHRIVSIDKRGIRTRGDNSDRIDPWVLKLENVLGRVVYVKKAAGWRRIHGGRAGILRAGALRPARRLGLLAHTGLRGTYRRLARSGILWRWVPHWLRPTPRVLFFDRAESPELQLLIGTRVIGRYLWENQEWDISSPYRLVVDESALPKPLNCESIRSPAFTKPAHLYSSLCKNANPQEK